HPSRRRALPEPSTHQWLPPPTTCANRTCVRRTLQTKCSEINEIWRMWYKSRMILIVVKFKTKPDWSDRWLDLVEGFTEATREEPRLRRRDLRPRSLSSEGIEHAGVADVRRRRWSCDGAARRVGRPHGREALG